MVTGSDRMRLTRAQSRQRTRDLLVAAAMRVFARAGYAGASVDAIAAEAGFTVGALYSNFATKQELFLAALEKHCADELSGLRDLIDATPGREELLDALVKRSADLDGHREWWQLWVEMWLYAQRNPEAAPRFQAIQDETRAAVAEALGRGELSADSEVVALVHALWTGVLMYRLINPDALPAAGFGRAVRWLLAGHHRHSTN